MKKKEYIPPTITVTIIETEECIATSSIGNIYINRQNYPESETWDEGNSDNRGLDW